MRMLRFVNIKRLNTDHITTRQLLWGPELMVSSIQVE